MQANSYSDLASRVVDMFSVHVPIRHTVIKYDYRSPFHIFISNNMHIITILFHNED